MTSDRRFPYRTWPVGFVGLESSTAPKPRPIISFARVSGLSLNSSSASSTIGIGIKPLKTSNISS